MTIYYKATKLDGTDFRTGTVDYAGALASGVPVSITGRERDFYECCTADVLHAADVPTETLIGCSWPCRLFEVEGEPVAQEGNKYGFRELTMVREIDATLALGPQGAEIVALIARAAELTPTDAGGLRAAGDAAWCAAWGAARDAAWGAARDAAWGAARDAARGAAGDAARDAGRDAARCAARDAAAALVARDLIGDRFTQEHYDTLTGPWRRAIGPLHPDDAVLA